MNLKKCLYLPSLFACVVFASCQKDNDTPGPAGPAGPPGNKTLLNITDMAPGEDCGNGGLLIKSGVDKNQNDTLDESEIDNAQKICNGINGSYDKQIYFQLAGFESVIKQAGDNKIFMALPGFNKANFTGVDSIILYAQPAVGHRFDGTNGPAVTATVELYNMTDNVPIGNSALTSSQVWQSGFETYYTNAFYKTNNIYSSFPDQTFDLGIKLSTAFPGDYARAGKVILILYRK